LPERSTRPMQKYMQKMFERDSFRASLTEAELEMRE
jgi:RNA polymerase-associated protein